jgi:hypothetical protein
MDAQENTNEDNRFNRDKNRKRCFKTDEENWGIRTYGPLISIWILFPLTIPFLLFVTAEQLRVFAHRWRDELRDNLEELRARVLRRRRIALIKDVSLKLMQTGGLFWSQKSMYSLCISAMSRSDKRIC